MKRSTRRSRLTLAVTLFEPGDPSLVYAVFPIFNDGFESSSTIRWSLEEPN